MNVAVFRKTEPSLDLKVPNGSEKRGQINLTKPSLVDNVAYVIYANIFELTALLNFATDKLCYTAE